MVFNFFNFNKPPKNELEQTEKIIPKSELLVSPEYTGEEDISQEIELRTRIKYPGYPEEWVQMTAEEIEEWKSNGARQSELPITVVSEHPNYKSGLDKGMADEYDPNDDSLPIIESPYLEMMLKSGVVRGPGFYWKFKESIKNPAGDPIVIRIHEGKLQVLVIERTDMPGLWALAGGMEDKEEKGVSTATRELFEEAGVDLSNTPHEIVFDYETDKNGGYVFGDPRCSINAMPVTRAALIMPTYEETLDFKFKPKEDEVRQIKWIDATEENLDMKNFSVSTHARLVKIALREWQKIQNKAVSKEGEVGMLEE